MSDPAWTGLAGDPESQPLNGGPPRKSAQQNTRAFIRSAYLPVTRTGWFIILAGVIVACIVIGLTYENSREAKNDTQDVKEVIRFYDHDMSYRREAQDVWEDFARRLRRGQAADIAELFDKNGVYCNPRIPVGCLEGRNKIKEWFTNYTTAGNETAQSLELREFVFDIFNLGAVAEAKWTATVVHNNTNSPVPAGSTYSQSWSQDFWINNDGKVTKWQDYFDTNQTTAYWIPPPLLRGRRHRDWDNDDHDDDDDDHHH